MRKKIMKDEKFELDEFFALMTFTEVV